MRDHKILDLSTGSVKTAEQVLDDGTLLELGDDFFNDWQSGSRSVWSVRCPSCGQLQPEVLTHRDHLGRPLKGKNGEPVYGFVWDENSVTRPGGRWHIAELMRTVRWRCRSCPHELADTDDNIRALNDPANGAGYVVTNPLHDPTIWSYRFPAWVSFLVGWRTIVVEWVKALESTRAGDHLALKTVVQNRFAEAWDESITIGDESKASGDYDLDAWVDDPDGRFASGRMFLTVDRQRKDGGHFWAVARMWNDLAESRLVGFWKLYSYEEVRAKQGELGIKDHRVLIDSGDQTAEVYGVCVLYGWTALKGEDTEYFLHQTAKKNAAPIQRYYSKPAKGDPVMGKNTRKLAADIRKAMAKRRFAKLYRWASGPVRDILAALIAGNSRYWGRPKIEPEHYADQLDSEVKKHVRTKSGRERAMWVPIKLDNHARDCEAMQVVAALMSGIMKSSMEDAGAER